jgi:hypothetical protein
MPHRLFTMLIDVIAESGLPVMTAFANVTSALPLTRSRLHGATSP